MRARNKAESKKGSSESETNETIKTPHHHDDSEKYMCPCVLARQILFSGPNSEGIYFTKENTPPYLHKKWLESSYRVHFSWKNCVASVFALHNETFNIWTALPGVFIFLYFLALFWFQTDFTGISPRAPLSTIFGEIPSLTSTDFLIFLPFFLSSMFSFIASSCFHIFMCISPDLFVKLHNLDYAGISCLIAGSFFPPIYYAFNCEHNLIKIYLIAISIIASLGSIIILDSRYHNPKYKPLRIGIFVFYAGFGVFPLLHLVFTYGLQQRVLDVLSGMFGMYVTYLIGVFFYASHIPERIFPGKFDIFLHSHQIWHVFVLAGTCVHYIACLRLLSQQTTQGCIQPLTN